MFQENSEEAKQGKKEKEEGVRRTKSGLYVASESLSVKEAREKAKKLDEEGSEEKRKAKKDSEAKSDVGSEEKELRKKAASEAARVVNAENAAQFAKWEAHYNALNERAKNTDDEDELRVLREAITEMSRGFASLRGNVAENLILLTRERFLEDIRRKEGRQPNEKERSRDYYLENVRDWFDGNLRRLEMGQESFHESGQVYAQLVADVVQLEGSSDTEAIGRALREMLEKRKNFRQFMRIYEVAPFDQTSGQATLLNNDVWEMILTLETNVDTNGKKEKKTLVADEFRNLCIRGREIKNEMDKLQRLEFKQGKLLRLNKSEEAAKIGLEIGRQKDRLTLLRANLVTYSKSGGDAKDANGQYITKDGERISVDAAKKDAEEKLSKILSEKEKLDRIKDYHLFNKLLNSKDLKGEEKRKMDELRQAFTDEPPKITEDLNSEEKVALKLKEVVENIEKFNKDIKRFQNEQWSRLMAGRLFSASLMAADLNIANLSGGGDFFSSRAARFGDEWAVTRGLLYKKVKAFWDPIARLAKRREDRDEDGLETYEAWTERTGGRLNFRVPTFLERIIDEMKIPVPKDPKEQDEFREINGKTYLVDTKEENFKKSDEEAWMNDKKVGEVVGHEGRQYLISRDSQGNKVGRRMQEKSMEYSEMRRAHSSSEFPADWIVENAIRKDLEGPAVAVNGKIFILNETSGEFLKDKEWIARAKKQVMSDHGRVQVTFSLDGEDIIGVLAREAEISDYDWSNKRLWSAIRTPETREGVHKDDPRFGVAENIASRDMFDEAGNGVEMLKYVFWGNQSALHNFTLEKLLESAKFGKHYGEFKRQEKVWGNYLKRSLFMMEDISKEEFRGIFRNDAGTPKLLKFRFIEAFADKDLITDETENEELLEHMGRPPLPFWNERQWAEIVVQADIVRASYVEEGFLTKHFFDNSWNLIKLFFKQIAGEDLGLR